MKNFEFTWYKIEKYATPAVRKNVVEAKDAKSACDVFCKVFGSLKRNEIVQIQELDVEGNAVGEPIVPETESAILPIKKGVK